ncbi:MAG TPA: long-chain fatty acid--CoA ligase, partial [Polyangia bacterium]|nr:long-chain fatty acid--CoA ligase [Polyangia bacterium]
MNQLNRNFALRVEATCLAQPDRPVMFHRDRSISYAELMRRIDGWTVALRAKGVGPGDTVALWLPNSPAFVTAFLATLRLGAIAVPLGVLLRPREVRQRLAIASPAALVTTPALAGELGVIDTALLAVEPDGGGLESSDRTPVVPRAEEDIAVLIFTSGTVGDARAAELTHEGILWNGRALAHGLALGPQDVQLAAAPLSHVLGMTGIMNATLLTGGALALMERFDAPSALPFMARTATSGIVGAPPMFAALVREARHLGGAPPLRFAMAGGAAMATELARDVKETFGCVLRDGYGMSEVGGGIAHTHVDVLPRPRSVGQPLPGSQVRIVDLSTGAPVPIGERGEVQVRSPSVMRGYRGNDEATRAAIDADGWLSTGDIGFLDGRLPVPGGSEEGAHHPVGLQRV